VIQNSNGAFWPEKGFARKKENGLARKKENGLARKKRNGIALKINPMAQH